MKNLWIVLLLGIAGFPAVAQSDSLTRTRIVVGISIPEFFHLGVNIDVSRSSQVGIGAGIGPSFGGVWTSLNLEHRLYFGNISENTLRRKYFFRQSFTNYPAGDNENAVALSAGIDLRSKKRSSGWTIDLELLWYSRVKKT